MGQRTKQTLANKNEHQRDVVPHRNVPIRQFCNEAGAAVWLVRSELVLSELVPSDPSSSRPTQARLDFLRRVPDFLCVFRDEQGVPYKGAGRSTADVSLWD